MVKNIKTEPITPKPVHTTAIRHHALFGPVYLKQHMLMDEHWRTDDLIDEYSEMAGLLKKRYIYKQMEKASSGKYLRKQHKNLLQQVQQGRVTLQKSIDTDIGQAIRSILINHKDMLRLYVNMSLQEIEENINQRTFVMRKERDRLNCQLEKMKKELEEKLRESSRLETRIRFENEFALHEELALRRLHTELANSQTRLKAIQSISTTYKQLMQILKNDEKFFEPILESLSKDLEDQQNFITHILYVGSPALQKLNELKKDYWNFEDIKRKQRQSKGQWISELKRGSWQTKRYPTTKSTNPVIDIRKHYARETRIMTRVKNHLMAIEYKIRQLQEATLSLKPETIYSIITKQTNHNFALSKQLNLEEMQSNLLKDKNTNLIYQQQFLKDDFCGKSLRQKEYIKHLNRLIAEEDHKKQQIMKSIQQNANVSVVVRCSLWNFSDILRHVNVKRQPKVKSFDYSKSYMTLPLLKYDNLEMRAAPPLGFEEDTLKLLNNVKEKLKKVTSAHEQMMKIATTTPMDVIVHNKENYCILYLKSGGKSEDLTGDLNLISMTNEESTDMDSPKDDVNIPSRLYIKDLSTKLVQTSLAKDY